MKNVSDHALLFTAIFAAVGLGFANLLKKSMPDEVAYPVGLTVANPVLYALVAYYCCCYKNKNDSNDPEAAPLTMSV